MHSCLLIPEITSIILESLLHDGPFPFQNLTVIKNFGLTCRALSEPALNLLWRNLPSPAPLIRVMPSDLWEVHKELEADWLYVVTNPWYKLEDKTTVDVYDFVVEPAEEDWNRLFYYNHRIRTLEIGSVGILHPEAFYFLTNHCPGSLLPKIQHISVELAVPYIAKAIPRCSPDFLEHITRVRISGGYFPFDEAPPFTAVIKYCTQAQYLEIWPPSFVSSSEMDVDWKLLSMMIQKLRQLREVKLHAEANLAFLPLSDDNQGSSTFRQLSHSENLSCLRIDCTVIPDSVLENVFSSPNGGFPSLTELYLDVSTYSKAVLILNGILLGHPPHTGFRVLYLRIIDSEENDFLTDFSKLMGIFHDFEDRLKSLTDLTLRLPRTKTLHNPNSAPDRRTCEAIRTYLSHLWTCVQLQYLSIDSEVCCTLDNAWLKTAAISWPFLRALWLDGSVWPRHATLEAHASFVEYCRELNHIWLPAIWRPFDIKLLQNSYTEGSSQALNTLGNKRVTSLYVSGAPEDIEQPEEVFRCIKVLYPELIEIVSCVGSGAWEELSRLIKGEERSD